MFRAPTEKFQNVQFYKVELSPRKPLPDVPILYLMTGDMVNVDVMDGDFVIISFNRNYRCGKYVLPFFLCFFCECGACVKCGVTSHTNSAGELPHCRTVADLLSCKTRPLQRPSDLAHAYSSTLVGHIRG